VYFLIAALAMNKLKSHFAELSVVAISSFMVGFLLEYLVRHL